MADALVLQSDFGVADGAVSAMYGVALSVSPTLRICSTISGRRRTASSRP